ncbi:CoA pyrophosphatase [Tropicimonas isoalkanivorans]|uniref:ADP-ribose pyrophosphatase YjhB, NUDIX family n=1 Tax=Tropicimonas isoalkanivorans TaxID=441112 RepID=A0A1I1M8X6_9RHOB|nr:CoA pyrophosphatase [Tropicimonas isoalkanivorans]SFC78100.1 ADP-ribose pyrophosphatase YjhB, NUDIX family [Tropicimonas isoalkanivorans]
MTTRDDLRARLKAAIAAPGHPSSDYDLNPDVVLPAGRRLRAAAVLVPVALEERGARLYLTKRSSRLKHHPGQVAFPGGKVDEGDANATAAALREAHEEIGLRPENVEVLGTLPSHETVTSFQMTPILGLLRDGFEPVPEPGEVQEVFSVPLDLVVTPSRFSVERRRWRGNWRRYYTVPHGPYYIWGATARILRALADRMSG